MLTYPRTDARALPEDYIGTVKATLDMLAGRDLQKGSDPSIANRYGIFADEIQKKNWVVPNKRIFNNAKISDHFAISSRRCRHRSRCRSRNRSSTTWWSSASWRCSTRRPNT